jgi:alkylation response protein AidB-like acyl-CoA dehydrogenase
MGGECSRQLFGGMGYMAESEVERQYRDMRILGIGGGTAEILTSLAAKTHWWTRILFAQAVHPP